MTDRFSRGARRGIWFAVAALLVGCVADPPPIRFAASVRPSTIERDESAVRSEFEDGSIRFGLLYRAPVDVSRLLADFESKQGVSVLENVSLRLQVPFCYTVFCIGRDVLKVGVGRVAE